MTTHPTAALARRLPTKTDPMKTYLRGCAILVAWLAIAFPLQGLAATYFVNSNGGNDNYNGAAPTWTSGSNGPWQTLAKLAAVTLVPNDTVYLACGSVWNETLKVPSSGATNVPITITAGPGNCTTPPLIDGAVTIPAHQWVQHSGSIYKAKLPIDLMANPNPGVSMAGWTQWAATGDSTLVADTACPGQTAPCMAFTSGTSNSIAISNNFAISGGVEYTAGVQLRAPVGTQIKVVVRRAGPTYDSMSTVQWVTAAGVWQSVGFTFRAGVSVNARMDIEIPGSRIKVNLREAHLLRALPQAGVTAAFVDGLQVRRAHHPNFGQGGNASSPYATVAGAGAKTVVDTSGLAFPAGATLTTGLGVAIRTTNWALEERLITSITGSRVTLSAPTYYDIQPGYGFYLTGALWMLNSPGEWFYDAATTTMYVWMPDSTVPGSRVAISGLGVGADLDGKANIVLKDLAVRHVVNGMALTYSKAVTLSGVSVADATGYGVSAENCTLCTVQNSSIARTGLDAVSVPGAVSVSFTLRDSSIRDSGASTRTDGWRMLPRPARGAVYAIGAMSVVLRNFISGTSNPGVYVGPNGIITDNYFGQACLFFNDCGGIYTSYLGPQTTIARNVVDTVIGNTAGVPGNLQTQVVGIYVDDRSTNVTVSGNTVTGADYGIQLHNANTSTVSDNLVFGNRRYQVWMQEQTNVARAAGDIFGNTISNNVLVPTAGGPAVYLESEIGNTTDFASFSGNQYSALLSSRVVGERNPVSSASYTVADWQAAGRETGARVTQPVGYASFLAGTANIVPNGGLGNGFLGWTWWNQTAPLSTIALQGCSFGPCLRLTAGGSQTLLSSPNFSVTGGQWYRVTFDAATSQNGQPINAVVRRGGGGTAGYEYLMPAAESFTGSTSWQRYSFVFQASKSVTAGDPATQELGARVDFERNQPNTQLTVGRLEMTTLSPAQAALQIKLLLNAQSSATSFDCASLGVDQSLCSYFVNLGDDSPVNFPATVGGLSGRPIYTRDTTLTDSDGDGIADQQDACPNTIRGLAVNARGCAVNQ